MTSSPSPSTSPSHPFHSYHAHLTLPLLCIELLLFLYLVLFSLPTHVEAQNDGTYPTGPLTHDTTWTSQDTILLVGPVIVPQGMTLTITEGTRIIALDATASLIIRGTLICQGVSDPTASSRRILFTSATIGSTRTSWTPVFQDDYTFGIKGTLWDGIIFESTAVAATFRETIDGSTPADRIYTYASGSIISHTDILFAGRTSISSAFASSPSPAAIMMASTPYMEDVRIWSNVGHGIWTQLSDSVATLPLVMVNVQIWQSSNHALHYINHATTSSTRIHLVGFNATGAGRSLYIEQEPIMDIVIEESSIQNNGQSMKLVHIPSSTTSSATLWLRNTQISSEKDGVLDLSTNTGALGLNWNIQIQGNTIKGCTAANMQHLLSLPLPMSISIPSSVRIASNTFDSNSAPRALVYLSRPSPPDPSLLLLVSIESNTFVNNGGSSSSATILVDGPMDDSRTSVTIQKNIFSNSKMACEIQVKGIVLSPIKQAAVMIDARENSWNVGTRGGPTPTAIESRICDFRRDASLPLIPYWPWRLGGDITNMPLTDAEQPSPLRSTESPVQLGGEVWRDLTIPAGTYTLTGSLLIRPRVTLTLEAGVSLSFPQFMGIRVEGTLKAVGSSTSRIKLQQAPGNDVSFYGIMWTSIADDVQLAIDGISYQSGSQLVSVDIDGTGWSTLPHATLKAYGSTPWMNDVSIINSKTTAITLISPISSFIPFHNIIISKCNEGVRIQSRDDDGTALNAHGGRFIFDGTSCSIQEVARGVIATTGVKVDIDIRNCQFKTIEAEAITIQDGVKSFSMSGVNIQGASNALVQLGDITESISIIGNILSGSNIGITMTAVPRTVAIPIITITDNDISGCTSTALNIPMIPSTTSPGSDYTLVIRNNTIHHNNVKSGTLVTIDGIDTSTSTGTYNWGLLAFQNNKIQFNTAGRITSLNMIQATRQHEISLNRWEQNTILAQTSTMGSGVLFVNAVNPMITRNAFLDQQVANEVVVVTPASSITNIAAPANWWGTTDIDTIRSHIYDGFKDTTRAKLDIDPILTSDGGTTAIPPTTPSGTTTAVPTTATVAPTTASPTTSSPTTNAPTSSQTTASSSTGVDSGLGSTSSNTGTNSLTGTGTGSGSGTASTLSSSSSSSSSPSSSSSSSSLPFLSSSSSLSSMSLSSSSLSWSSSSPSSSSLSHSSSTPFFTSSSSSGSSLPPSSSGSVASTSVGTGPTPPSSVSVSGPTVSAAATTATGTSSSSTGSVVAPIDLGGPVLLPSSSDTFTYAVSSTNIYFRFSSTVELNPQSSGTIRMWYLCRPSTSTAAGAYVWDTCAIPDPERVNGTSIMSRLVLRQTLDRQQLSSLVTINNGNNGRDITIQLLPTTLHLPNSTYFIQMDEGLFREPHTHNPYRGASLFLPTDGRFPSDVIANQASIPVRIEIRLQVKSPFSIHLLNNTYNIAFQRAMADTMGTAVGRIVIISVIPDDTQSQTVRVQFMILPLPSTSPQYKTPPVLSHDLETLIRHGGPPDQTALTANIITQNIDPQFFTTNFTFSGSNSESDRNTAISVSSIRPISDTLTGVVGAMGGSILVLVSANAISSITSSALMGTSAITSKLNTHVWELLGFLQVAASLPFINYNIPDSYRRFGENMAWSNFIMPCPWSTSSDATGGAQSQSQQQQKTKSFHRIHTMSAVSSHHIDDTSQQHIMHTSSLSNIARRYSMAGKQLFPTVLFWFGAITVVVMLITYMLRWLIISCASNHPALEHRLYSLPPNVLKMQQQLGIIHSHSKPMGGKSVKDEFYLAPTRHGSTDPSRRGSIDPHEDPYGRAELPQNIELGTMDMTRLDRHNKRSSDSLNSQFPGIYEHRRAIPLFNKLRRRATSITLHAEPLTLSLYERLRIMHWHMGVRMLLLGFYPIILAASNHVAQYRDWHDFMTWLAVVMIIILSTAVILLHILVPIHLLNQLQLNDDTGVAQVHPRHYRRRYMFLGVTEAYNYHSFVFWGALSAIKRVALAIFIGGLIASPSLQLALVIGLLGTTIILQRVYWMYSSRVHNTIHMCLDLLLAIQSAFTLAYVLAPSERLLKLLVVNTFLTAAVFIFHAALTLWETRRPLIRFWHRYCCRCLVCSCCTSHVKESEEEFAREVMLQSTALLAYAREQAARREAAKQANGGNDKDMENGAANGAAIKLAPNQTLPVAAQAQVNNDVPVQATPTTAAAASSASGGATVRSTLATTQRDMLSPIISPGIAMAPTSPSPGPDSNRNRTLAEILRDHEERHRQMNKPSDHPYPYVNGTATSNNINHHALTVPTAHPRALPSSALFPQIELPAYAASPRTPVDERSPSEQRYQSYARPHHFQRSVPNNQTNNTMLPASAAASVTASNVDVSSFSAAPATTTATAPTSTSRIPGTNQYASASSIESVLSPHAAHVAQFNQPPSQELSRFHLVPRFVPHRIAASSPSPPPNRQTNVEDAIEMEQKHDVPPHQPVTPVLQSVSAAAASTSNSPPPSNSAPVSPTFQRRGSLWFQELQQRSKRTNYRRHASAGEITSPPSASASSAAGVSPGAPTAPAAAEPTPLVTEIRPASELEPPADQPQRYSVDNLAY